MLKVWSEQQKRPTFIIGIVLLCLTCTACSIPGINSNSTASGTGSLC